VPAADERPQAPANTDMRGRTASAPAHTPQPTGEPDDKTGCEDTDGNVYLVDLHEHAAVIVFRAEDGQRVASYSFGTFAGVENALALDLGRGIVLDAVTVAEVQQWATLDAFGLRERLRQECDVVGPAASTCTASPLSRPCWPPSKSPAGERLPLVRRGPGRRHRPGRAVPVASG